MGRQIRVYLTAPDLADLEEQLSSVIDLAILESRTNGPAPVVLHSLAVEEFGRTPLTVFLARSDDVRRLRPHRVRGQDYWTLDVLKEPVVQFDRPYVGPTIVRQGRLYFEARKHDTGTKGDESFGDWASSLFAVVRRSLRRSPNLDAYLGRDAGRLHSAGSTAFLPS